MRSERSLATATLLVMLACGGVAEARPKMPAASPIDITFDARLRRDDRGQRVCDLKLAMDSLIGSDAEAAGDYSLYVDGSLVARDSFDTRDTNASDVREPRSRDTRVRDTRASDRRGSLTVTDTAALDGTRHDAVACAVVQIRRASVLGHHAPVLEKIHTRCLRLVPDAFTRTLPNRVKVRRDVRELLKPPARRYELKFDKPLQVGAFTFEWLELQDSRCPVGVDCIWAGAARVLLGVRVAGLELPEIELTLGADISGEATSEVVLGGNSIELVAVEPYPEIDVAVAREELTATLVIGPPMEPALGPEY